MTILHSMILESLLRRRVKVSEQITRVAVGLDKKRIDFHNVKKQLERKAASLGSDFSDEGSTEDTYNINADFINGRDAEKFYRFARGKADYAEIHDSVKHTIKETKIDDPELASKIDELTTLKIKIGQIKKELKPLESRLGELAEEILPVVEELDDKIARTDKAVITITKASYERQSPKYKEAFLTALTKVNRQTRAVLEEILKELTSVSKVAAQFKAASLESVLEDSFREKVAGLLGRIGKKVLLWVRAVKNIGKSVNDLERLARSA